MLTTRALGTVLALLMSRNAWAQTAPEPEAPTTPPVKLELEGTPVDVKFHVTPLKTVGAPAPHGGKPGSCLAPCEGQVPPGTYRIALSAPGTSPVASEEPITISGPATVHGELVSYKWLRSTGWVVLGAGTIAGFAAAAAIGGEHSSGEVPGMEGIGAALVGTSVVLVSLFVGLPMILTTDEVKITVSPLTTASLRRSDAAPSIASALLPRGVGLSGAF
jgi:hypothetical protein